MELPLRVFSCKVFILDSQLLNVILHAWRKLGSLLEGSAGGAAIRMQGGVIQERILLPLGTGR
jgi:hypothetical protein